MSDVSRHDELQPMNDTTRIAVMSAELFHIGKAVARIEQNGSLSVPRVEWEQRNAYVDMRLIECSAKTADLKAEISGRRAPWWTVIAAGAGILAVIAYLFDLVPAIVN